MGNRVLRVGPKFDREIRRITAEVNQYLFTQGEYRQMSVPKVTDMIIENIPLSITAEQVMRKGHKGKRLIFSGEVRI